MATIEANNETRQASNEVNTEAKPQATALANTDVRQHVGSSSTSDRAPAIPLDPERERLVEKVVDSLGAKVYQDLAKYHPGRSARWFAERAVDQAEVNARNSFKELSQVTDAELARATRTTLSKIKSKIISPREGPKANNGRLLTEQDYEKAGAILESVTDYSAHQTLKNYLRQVGDERFVQDVKPALTRGGAFAWSGTEWRRHGEQLQHELVHKLLMDGTIPQECRYKAKDAQDPHAIGIEHQERKEHSARRYAQAVEADRIRQEEKQQQILDGYITGARSERERAQIVRSWRTVAESPLTDEAHRNRLNSALEKAKANDPRVEPVSKYIDSTKNKYSPADIDYARRFAPEAVLVAMRERDPKAFEQSRPATNQEILQLREKLKETGESISRGLDRSEDLLQKIESINGRTISSEVSQLIAQDRSKLARYTQSCQEIKASLTKLNTLCDQLEGRSITDPEYQRLLTEFKAAQREILRSGGANDQRAQLGRELVMIETRYRLGNEQVTKPDVLTRLSSQEKSKALLTLEGTLSTQLAQGEDISHTLKAFQALDGDPKRLASYLYRLERDGRSELVEKFAAAVSSNTVLKGSLERVLADSTAKLSDTQKEHVKKIQDAL